MQPVDPGRLHQQPQRTGRTGREPLPPGPPHELPGDGSGHRVPVGARVVDGVPPDPLLGTLPEPGDGGEGEQLGKVCGVDPPPVPRRLFCRLLRRLRGAQVGRIRLVDLDSRFGRLRLVHGQLRLIYGRSRLVYGRLRLIYGRLRLRRLDGRLRLCGGCREENLLRGGRRSDGRLLGRLLHRCLRRGLLCRGLLRHSFLGCLLPGGRRFRRRHDNHGLGLRDNHGLGLHDNHGLGGRPGLPCRRNLLRGCRCGLCWGHRRGLRWGYRRGLCWGYRRRLCCGCRRSLLHGCRRGTRLFLRVRPSRARHLWGRPSRALPYRRWRGERGHRRRRGRGARGCGGTGRGASTGAGGAPNGVVAGRGEAAGGGGSSAATSTGGGSKRRDVSPRTLGREGFSSEPAGSVDFGSSPIRKSVMRLRVRTRRAARDPRVPGRPGQATGIVTVIVVG